MPIDPAIVTTDETEKRAGQLADLDRRLRNLERGQSTIQVANGAPSASAATLREGTPYVDRTNNRLYVVVNATWKSVALT